MGATIMMETTMTILTIMMTMLKVMTMMTGDGGGGERRGRGVGDRHSGN